LNPRPLGYEPYDVRLPRLGQSPATALASADLRYEVVPGLLRLPRLSPSRRVSCTNACTNQPPGLLVRVGQQDRPIWRTAGTGASSVVTRTDIRIRSDRSVTSSALLPAVQVSPENWKVVRPRSSQCGSRPHMTPGTVTPWSSPPISDLRPARGPRAALLRPLPRNPTAAGPGDGRVRSRPSWRVHEPCSWPEAVACGHRTGLTGSGSHGYSYGGFGGRDTHTSTRPAAGSPVSPICIISLGSLWRCSAAACG
jgi:hypothetical protein